MSFNGKHVALRRRWTQRYDPVVGAELGPVAKHEHVWRVCGRTDMDHGLGFSSCGDFSPVVMGCFHICPQDVSRDRPGWHRNNGRARGMEDTEVEIC